MSGWIRPTLDAQVAAKEGLCHIDIFDLNLDVVILTIRLLSTLEFTARPKEGGGPIGYYLRKHIEYINM